MNKFQILSRRKKSTPAKVVYVPTKNKWNEYLCLISIDITLDENEIFGIYEKRWDIKVLFKICKSYLKLNKKWNSLSYDAMIAHVAVFFTRYMMLPLKIRKPRMNVLLANSYSFYTFLTNYLISHGYRLFN